MALTLIFDFLLLVKEVREAFAMEEVRWYLIIFAAATLMIAANLTIVQGGSPFYYLHHSAFQVASVMTTTGFATVDFNLWPNFCKVDTSCIDVYRCLCGKYGRRYESIEIYYLF